MTGTYHRKLTFQALRLALCAMIMIIVCASARAQEPRLYTSDETLSSGLVNRIVQDSRGYIWIATENGLNRYDGTRFKTYYVDGEGDGKSLLSNYVRTVYETSDGHVLVGCVNGLMEYDRRSDTFKAIPMKSKGKKVRLHVYDIRELSSGEVWVATAGAGLFRYDRAANEARSIDKVNALVGSEFVSCIYEDSSHVLWIGTEKNGVCRYYTSSGKARCFRMPELSGNIVQSMVEDNDGRLYVATYDGGINIYDRREERFTPVPVSDGTAVRRVSALARVGNRILAGTDGDGIRILEDGRLVSRLPVPSAPEGGRKLKVQQILDDRDGNLWLGVYQQGVICLPRKRYKFDYYGKMQHEANPIGSGCVMAVFKDRDNTTWVSCDNEGIYHLDQDGRQLSHDILPGTAMCMMRDRDGSLWAGTYPAGAFRMSGPGSWNPVPGLAGRKIYSMAQAPDGMIYIGSLDKGLEMYDPSTGRVTDCLASEHCRMILDNANVLNCVNSLLTSKGNIMWVAHYNGISCYDLKARKFLRPNGALNLVRDAVGYSLMEDRNGHVWMGTSSGLWRYDPQTRKMRRYTTADGLPNNVISGLAQDEQGRVWISTYHGMARLDPKQGKVTVYDAGDGLQGNEFTHGAYCQDEHGRIFFGGLKGVTSFHPGDIEDSESKYKPVITEVGAYLASSADRPGEYQVVSGGPGKDGKVSLASDQNTIRIFFSTLTYDNPSKIRFEYRVTQKSTDWVTMEPGQNMVTFYNLSSGTYDFEIRVADNPEAVTHLKIVIAAPWYLSWPMKLLYALTGCGLCWVAWYIYRRHRRARKEIARQQRAEEMAEAKLQLFTDFSHKLRAPMTLIVDPMRKLLARCTDETVKQTYTLIYNSSLRVMELVNELVDNPRFENEEKPEMTVDWNSIDSGPVEKAISSSRVVIVESDDEVRRYMELELKKHYRNVTAYSSAEESFGNILAMNPLPDIIVSGVMMREGMDGVAFTRKLKQNPQLNHIPVILLSAKSEAGSIKEAVESGADNFLVKPVSSELLLSTIGTVLGNRHLLKVKFSGLQEQEDKIEKIVLKSADDMLMKRVMETVNKNLGSSEFSVEMLAESVGMSRAHLHRKLKELTNLSARDFIRSIRMKQAARLLTENNLTIAEVAYATGFSNASHFSTVFKDYFGQTPTRYVKSASHEIMQPEKAEERQAVKQSVKE